MVDVADQVGAKLQPGAMHAAFQRSDRASRLLRRVLIGLLLQNNHGQRLALVGWQPLQRPSQFMQRHAILVRSGNRNLRQIGRVGEFALAAHAADEVVDHDPVHPRGEICSWDEAVLRDQYLGRDVLRQIVGGSAIASQSECPHSHFRHERNKLIVKFVLHRLRLLVVLSRSAEDTCGVV